MKDRSKQLPFGKSNYQLMLTGILVLAMGFTLIALDQEVHGFGALGLTIGPIAVITGLAIEFFAIMYRKER